MQDSEQGFLMKEYETAWQMIQKIDDRRGAFARYYSILFTAVVGIAGNILIGTQDLTLQAAISISFLFFFGALAGFITIKILQSERKGNVRYRQKINLIREIFLAKSKDTAIKKYLKHKELGIKLFSNQAKNQPQGIGQTLRWIFGRIIIQIVVLLIAILAIWILF